MAKRQTRRTISFNRNNYEAVKLEAARRGVTLAALVEAALEAYGVPMVEHPRQSVELARANAAAKRKKLKKLPSRERKILGNRIADAYGFQ